MTWFLSRKRSRDRNGMPDQPSKPESLPLAVDPKKDLPSSTTITMALSDFEPAPVAELTVQDLNSAHDAPVIPFPREAFLWIVQNNIASDTELAAMSNVCSEWRIWLADCLVKDSTSAATDSISLRDAPLTEQLQKRCRMDDEIEKKFSPLPRHLLLPSMMRKYMTEHQRPQEADTAIEIQEIEKRRKEVEESKDNFCVAWFAPEGIQRLSWTQILREDEAVEKMILDAQDSGACRDLTREILSTNHSASDDNEDETIISHLHTDASTKATKTTAASSTRTPLEQQTHQDSMEQQKVSHTSLSWQMKSKATILSNEWRGYRDPLQVLQPFGYAQTFIKTLFSTLAQHRIAGTRDSDIFEDQEEYAKASFAVRGVTVARPESYCLCIDHIEESLSSNHEARLQRLKDRKDLRRTVLPRVMEKEGSPPFIQFLNVDKSSAVTLMTPALDCGVLKGPFTIFVVGIATEDGCFLSGLHHRFEIGHLYPRDQLAEVTESSAICLFTEEWSPEDSSKRDKMDVDDDAMAENSDDSWDGDGGFKDAFGCNCVFEGITEKLSGMEDEDQEGRRGRLVRGVIGPGTWHCYTIVVDGNDSVIRVDGVEEPVERKHKNCGPALLDGLTLGSDHCFGTSLCCGQGSPGEGEGAMAEVAVFHGRLDTRDISTLEKQLMKRHGIPSPHGNPWRENDLSRQAQAMFHLVGNPRGNRVPLRYFAQSPSVAWKRYNPVNNESIRRERIGARGDDDSSDW